MIDVATSVHIATLAFTVLTKWLVIAFDHDNDNEYDDED